MSSPAKAKVRANAAKKREEAAAGSETDDEFPSDQDEERDGDRGAGDQSAESLQVSREKSVPRPGQSSVSELHAG